MRPGFLALVLMLGLGTPVQAQVPRDVLLEVCNQTGFSVAAAAAYRTSPADSRTLRSWFLIAPGECLNGALNNVVGDTLDLHVMSGSWSWPSAAAAIEYCVPADATLIAATAPPCQPGRQARGFVRLPVEATSHRGAGGRTFGRVGYRVRCEGLSGEDAGLCPGAPTDARGMAGFVRELEFCNNNNRPVRVAAGEAGPDGDLEFQGWQDIPGGVCEVIFRGFPQGNQLLYAEPGSRSAGQGLICLPDGQAGPALATPRGSAAEACPPDRPVQAGYQRVEYRAQTGRMTVYPSQ